MGDSYDVVVVGARCAGAPLAAHLARAGRSVAVVDRAEFPSDAPCAHILGAEGASCLGRLGVLDRVLATGAPWLEREDLRIESVRAVATVPLRPAGAGPGLCVRRRVLDKILVEEARRAGAAVFTSTRVVGLLADRAGRVGGVAAVSGGRERELGASLVVGADGTGSTVARLVGARRYGFAPNQRFWHCRYFEGAAWSSPATLVYHRWGRRLVIAAPGDAGLCMVAIAPPLDRLAELRADPEALWAGEVAGCEPVRDLLATARPVGRPRTIATFPSFFREAAGRGWALVGDAGHCPEPAGGQGISLALRHAERLAHLIAAGPTTDAATRAWRRWRDADTAEVHAFSAALGAAGPFPEIAPAALGQEIGRRPAPSSASDEVEPSRAGPAEAGPR